MNNLKKNLAAVTVAGAIALTGAAFLNNDQPQQVEAATVGQTVSINYVPGYGINVWSTPYANRVFTGQRLAHGTAWKVIRTAYVAGQTWYDLGNGQWIQAQYTVDGRMSSVAGPTQTVQNVINLAKKQIGKPYQWAGKGPSAFDCSGLMYYVFSNAAGKNIGGWTVPQESAGTKVSVSNLKAGDLVFWGSAGNTYHVGLYIGNNQYIHSPNPGQTVTTASISSYFAPSFGVRVL